MTDATHGDTAAGTDQGQDWTIALDSVLDHVYNALALGQTEDEADGTDVVATAWLHQLGRNTAAGRAQLPIPPCRPGTQGDHPARRPRTDENAGAGAAPRLRRPPSPPLRESKMNELRRRIASIKKMAERHCPPEPSDRSHWYTSANDCVFLNSKDTNHVRPHTIIVASFQSQDEAQSATIALNQARPFEWAPPERAGSHHQGAGRRTPSPSPDRTRGIEKEKGNPKRASPPGSRPSRPGPEPHRQPEGEQNRKPSRPPAAATSQWTDGARGQHAKASSSYAESRPLKPATRGGGKHPRGAPSERGRQKTRCPYRRRRRVRSRSLF